MKLLRNGGFRLNYLADFEETVWSHDDVILITLGLGAIERSQMHMYMVVFSSMAVKLCRDWFEYSMEPSSTRCALTMRTINGMHVQVFGFTCKYRPCGTFETTTVGVGREGNSWNGCLASCMPTAHLHMFLWDPSWPRGLVWSCLLAITAYAQVSGSKVRMICSLLLLLLKKEVLRQEGNMATRCLEDEALSWGAKLNVMGWTLVRYSSHHMSFQTCMECIYVENSQPCPVAAAQCPSTNTPKAIQFKIGSAYFPSNQLQVVSAKNKNGASSLGW